MDRSVFRPYQGETGERAFVRPMAKICMAVVGLLALVLLSYAASAQTPSASPAQPESGAQAGQPSPPAHNPDKLFVDADEIVYDKDKDVVTATGNVVLYYKGRTLQADKVVYDRHNKRMQAIGHGKFIDEHGDVTYAPKFDLTDDFANGFANGVQALTTDRTRFSSPHIERSGGDITTMDYTTYTACEPCKAHPEWPPEWQIRAGKVIEDQETHTIYFENAWIDVFGVPIGYMPYMSAPDPTVTRKSGILPPSYTSSTNLGSGFSVPYFLALAPNYDVTITPYYYTRQGPALDLEWRHRIENGEYRIIVSGVDQQDPQAFAGLPGDRQWRGSAQTDGKLLLNQNWTFGWDVTAQSDKNYVTDYKLLSISPNDYFLQDQISQVYLRGQADRGFFDLTAYYFYTYSSYLDQRQEPIAAPVFDYQRTFPVDPKTSNGIGGEVSLTLNAANVNREEALYEAIPKQEFDSSYNQYSVCGPQNPAGTGAPAQYYTPENCLLRGMAGDYFRTTGQVSWQTKYVDPIGEVWKPFIYAVGNGMSTDLNTTGSFTYGTDVVATNANTIPNYAQPAFFNGYSSATVATGMVGVGLEYRYPFVYNSGLGQQTIEPIVQVIARPNAMQPSLRPNEDAQSLVFDTTNLFAWSKYSGFDRVEGGTRLNYGLQYNDNLPNGGHFNVMGGESIALAGQNPYTIPDAANTGLESGLDKTFSDFVASETLQPTAMPIYVISRQQFDSSNFALARLDGVVGGSFGDFGANVDYAQYAAQPLLGWPYPRDGLTASFSYKPKGGGWNMTGGIVFDMSRHFYDVPGESTPVFYPTGYNVALSYETSCTTFKAMYISYTGDPLSTTVGTPPPVTHNQTFLLQVTLRTIGDVVKLSSGTSSVTN
jgi:LPS-assembly protein